LVLHLCGMHLLHWLHLNHLLPLFGLLHADALRRTVP
jgi:hypothetical protein